MAVRAGISENLDLRCQTDVFTWGDSDEFTYAHSYETEMNADWVSAGASVVAAIAALCLAIVGTIGLWSWHGRVAAAEAIEQKKALRRLQIATYQLAKEVGLIRRKKVCNAELVEGIARIGNHGGYEPQPPEYYVTLVDRLQAELWGSWDDVLATVDESTDVYSALKQMAGTIARFRCAYAKLNLTAIVVMPILDPDYIPARVEVEDASAIAGAPDSGTDEFENELTSSVKRVHSAINSHLNKT